MYAMVKEQIIDVIGKKAETSKYKIAYTNDMESASTYIKTCYETELHDLGNKFTIYNKACFDTWYMICYRLDENTIVIDKMSIEFESFDTPYDVIDEKALLEWYNANLT